MPLFDLVANCITIRGSFVGRRQDMAEALAFAADGNVKADVEVQPLSSVNDVVERLEHGNVASRVVLELPGVRSVKPALAITTATVNGDHDELSLLTKAKSALVFLT